MFHLPSEFRGDVQIFNAPNNTVNVASQTWTKPKRCSMGFIFALGSGGGGGGAHSAAAGNNRGGGGGGGSGAVATWMGPLFLLPDTLRVCVSPGGVGGAATVDGGVGWQTKVLTMDDTVQGNFLIGTGTAGGGLKGTAVAAGTGGTAGAVLSIANGPLAGLGIFQSIAGQAGAIGGSPSGGVGGSITIPTTGIPCTGGAGGAGGTDNVIAPSFAGGAFNATAGHWASNGRPVAAAAGSNPGSKGTVFWKPFFSFGGCGGSSSDTAVGGAGGFGGYGSGGGGGGAGTTGGRGGDGGPGIVIIASW